MSDVKYPETILCFWCKNDMTLEEITKTCAIYYCSTCDERETEPMENHISEQTKMEASGARARRPLSDTHFTPRRRALAVYFTDEDVIELTVLYEKGLKDREIADEMGVNRGVIKYQRKKHSLLHSRLFTDQELVELHKEGYNDHEMGDKLGASEGVVFYHRKRLRLKANRYKSQNKPFIDQLVALNKKGLTDSEIAKKLGATKSKVYSRRRKLKLKANYRRT